MIVHQVHHLVSSQTVSLACQTSWSDKYRNDLTHRTQKTHFGGSKEGNRNSLALDEIMLELVVTKVAGKVETRTVIVHASE